MLDLLVIGIGAGNPEHMTVEGINALNAADVVLVPRKGAAKDELAEVRREICRRYLTNPGTRLVEFDLPLRDAVHAPYRNGVDDWHAAVAATYGDLLRTHLPDGGSAALLVWGDPSLYDSTLRIVERLRADAGLAFEYRVIPGITSVQALTSAHAIALNTIGDPVHITTGRRLRDGFPEAVDTVVVMLDGTCAFLGLDGEAFDIFWGAYLGTPDQITIAGRLCDVAASIETIRRDARDKKGWIMDTYLLRRRAN